MTPASLARDTLTAARLLLDLAERAPLGRGEPSPVGRALYCEVVAAARAVVEGAGTGAARERAA